MRASSWGLVKRKKLKLLIDEGYNAKHISEILDISYQAILNEIKRGTTADEYREKRWVKYSVERAAYTEVKDLFGDDVLKIVKNFEE